MARANIKFGTSGWRAIVADEFTVENIRRTVTGIARYVAAQRPQQVGRHRVIVGRDPRYMGEKFVSIASEILAQHGVTPLVITDAAPTPAISFEVLRAKADGAINFTASHNPPEYNGIKFNSPDGAPALPEVTHAIEAEVVKADRDGNLAGAKTAAGAVTSEEIDVKANYLARLKEIIDLPAIKKSGLKVVYDSFWGAGRGYPDTLLRDAGIPVASVHDHRDVLFGGHAPEPEGELLDEIRATMRETGARIGMATDCDPDRFGVVDADGSFLQPNYVIALLFDYLVETRGWKNGVAKSVATTNLINALARHYGTELHETPVGFKYIGELIKQDKIAIGGAENARLSIRAYP